MFTKVINSLKGRNFRSLDEILRYLQVKVKASRSRVPICNTLQSQVVSLHKAILRNDLKINVFCGVCEEIKGWKV